MRKFMLTLFCGAALLIFTITNCSRDKNPVSNSDTDHDHAEAVGLIISANGVGLIRYDKGQVSGELNVKKGDMTPLLTIQFIAEDGDLFQPQGDDYTLSWDVADAAVADVIQHDEDGKWRLHVRGQSSGSTTIVFKIFHGDHADFVSEPIPIRVTD
ncbi:hypothetical protein JXA70_05020 [candidate division KSB1 bacterium]|nr:hypothetical protein [candidate division KSB1 bacterium]